jgi:hypothetical protein
MPSAAQVATATASMSATDESAALSVDTNILIYSIDNDGGPRHE